ncbi:MAG: hypothetical protein V3T84_04610 [Phycisphaerales bacterium]
MRTSTFNMEIFAAASAALMVCGTAAGQTDHPGRSGPFREQRAGQRTAVQR